MERLKERLEKLKNGTDKMFNNETVQVSKKFCNQVVFYLEKLKEYKDLEEQGRLIVLPCKMGDTVYIIGSKYRRGYFEDYINTGKFDITDLPKLGNSVFLTKEEAEKTLERMKGE